MFTEEKLLDMYGSTIALTSKVENTEKEILALGSEFRAHAEKSNKHKEDMERGIGTIMVNVKTLETRVLVGFVVIASALKFSPDIIAKVLAMVGH